ncbi:MAG: 3-isopropylmalate dehydrogenase [Actinobacteria bacterium]|nr:3-isopropylmalate dehydrogenase [Actinomycetota bacterium]
MKIAVVKGDGTGPEVINEAIKVLNVATQRYEIPFSYQELDFSANRYLDTGQILSDDELDQLRQYDAILLGAIGDPRVPPGVLEKGILLKLRFELDQYINLRPVKLYPNVQTPLHNIQPEDIDYVVVRENTGGLYTGQGGFSEKNTPNEVATQEMIYSYEQVKRCLVYAYDMVLKRHAQQPWHGLSEAEKEQGYMGKLTLCGKTNVLTYVYDLWQRVLDELKDIYPQVLVDYVHVDAACIYMIECPQRFDVIVTGNMFGDIITDLAAVTQGGMGLAASGNINPNSVSMFEPIGGTAPQFTGLDQINPLAAISASHLLLDHLGYDQAALAIEEGKMAAIQQMTGMQAGKMGMGTTQVGDIVANAVAHPSISEQTA